MMPEMQYVDSSNVEAVGYDAEQYALYVQFLSGATYVYEGVEEEVFEELLEADSKGKFVNRRIKEMYSFQRL